ncbi:hydrogenase expression/formation protein HypE [Photobacterium jeanii]|uniref:Hydrogenase expression/formation protein HypE n=2 Tax=Vibrionaceae TaxID=641 RepID=A0A178K1Z1_9GAMM|nr:hydrogenase expression/formation protein HypE [Photobacterium jeanii]OAN11301.1 hydrogenase expression/formation protein HypE [Photobacterium jeanii]PST90821.1 hydrogenase expression/formation protein HypE [Photobacterium jeanii]
MKTVQLSHGGGGQEMNHLIKSLFFKYFENDILLRAEDAAVLELNGPVAFTSDSFTVSPLFFAGGNIGKLAIAGTVNDLAMVGAKPEYLSCSFIIEEGFAFDALETIVKSMKAELEKSGAKIVCGDTKVVPRGAADGLFINTTGVGSVMHPNISVNQLQAGDAILVSRDIGCHGSCILMARDELRLESELESDCATLWPVVEQLIASGVQLHAMRDATRGGLSAVLNEWCEASQVQIDIEEQRIPVADAVQGLCELYGFEPYDLANEGTMILAVPAKDAEAALAVLKGFSPNACQIGEVSVANSTDMQTADTKPTTSTNKVIIHNPWGGRHYLELPQGELLPRIC